MDSFIRENRSQLIKIRSSENGGNRQVVDRFNIQKGIVSFLGIPGLGITVNHIPCFQMKTTNHQRIHIDILLSRHKVFGTNKAIAVCHNLQDSMGFLGIRVSWSFSTNFISRHIVLRSIFQRLFSKLRVLGAFFIRLTRNSFFYFAGFYFACFRFHHFSFLCFSLISFRYSLLFFFCIIFLIHCSLFFFHCRLLFCSRLILYRSFFSASCFFLSTLFFPFDKRLRGYIFLFC